MKMDKKPLPGSEAKGAHLIVREGKRLMAHTHGQKHPIDISHPDVHHHIATDAHFQDGPQGEMVPLHKTYHTNPKSLPPALIALIEEAIRNFLATQDLHAQGAGDASLGPPSPSTGMPPPDMGMSSMGMPPPPAGLPGSIAA